jgi:hypothetical protein
LWAFFTWLGFAGAGILGGITALPGGLPMQEISGQVGNGNTRR